MNIKEIICRILGHRWRLHGYDIDTLSSIRMGDHEYIDGLDIASIKNFVMRHPNETKLWKRYICIRCGRLRRLEWGGDIKINTGTFIDE